MRHKRTMWLRLGVSALVCGALLSAGALPLARRAALAQGENLLQNPGFEEPYIAINGDETLRVAHGWQPWHVPNEGGSSAINARPEYKPAPANRVRSGAAAQEYNTFFATHIGGVYQRVPVPPGTELRFSVYIYVWSSATFANPNVSEDPNQVIVNVGIDPNGGTDGESPNIVWSADAEFYDEYRELSVTATAQSAAVTVFVRTAPQGFVGTNNIYVDDAALVALGQAPPPTSAPPSPAPTQDFLVPTQEGTVTPLPATPTPAFSPTPTAPPSTATPTQPPLPDDYNDTVLYTVVAGDTLWGIAQRYGSSVSAIVKVNGISENDYLRIGQTLLVPVRQQYAPPPTFTPAPTQAPGTGGPLPPTPVGVGTHTVQGGETLFSIARRYNTTVAALAQLNNIVNPNLIYVGQQLRVPQPNAPAPTPQPAPQPAPAPPPSGPKTHVVQAGENLFRISLRYNVSVDALARANGIWNPNLIFVGQVLTIP